MNYDELEAGPEMDRLVNECMALPHDSKQPWLGYASQSCESAIQFAEAFTESFTLFSPTKTSPYWLCSSIAKGVKATSLGKAATPSVAICRSVLKLLARDKA